LIILDEKSYAENLLKEGAPYPKLKDIIILAKYWKYLDFETHDIHRKLNEYCLKTDTQFNFCINGWKIKKALNSIKQYRLRTTFPIKITKAEVYAIKQWDNYNYQKILFVLLCWAKFLKYSNTRIKLSTRLRNINDFFVNEKLSNIIKIARVSMRKSDRNKMLHDFFIAGILDGTSYNSLKIKCVVENSDPEILVTDYENIVLYWQRYCGERVMGCSCGRLFIQRNIRNGKCRKCWKEDRRKKQVIWDKNNWEKNKVSSSKTL
jgi:hypothetical protein